MTSFLPTFLIALPSRTTVQTSLPQRLVISQVVEEIAAQSQKIVEDSKKLIIL